MKTSLYDHEDIAKGLIAILSPSHFWELQRICGEYAAMNMRDDARTFLEGAAQATNVFHIPVAQFLAASARAFGAKTEAQRKALRVLADNSAADSEIDFGPFEHAIIEALLELIAEGLTSPERAARILNAAVHVQHEVTF